MTSDVEFLSIIIVRSALSSKTSVESSKIYNCQVYKGGTSHGLFRTRSIIGIVNFPN